MQDDFSQRKNEILNKKDKSSIGRWDEKILGLCEKINSLENFYTTSSCSGRILVIKDEDVKAPGIFEFSSHDKVQKLNLENMKGDLKFKQEPMILHIACRKLEDADYLMKLSQKAGFKKMGIIALGKRIVVEINASEKIEFPLTKKGKLLVDEYFLNLVLKKANYNLEKSWEKIEKLEKLIS